MKRLTTKAFTLVELLIVIGIIGILAVTLLVNLNPAEAQRKARDAARIKDSQALGVIIQQAIDTNTVPAAWYGDATITIAASPALTGTNSTFGVGTTAPMGTGGQPCAGTNWLGINTCSITKTVPIDPSNGRSGQCSTGAGTAVANCRFAYVIEMSGASGAPGSDYEINVVQESVSNIGKLQGDGGNAANLFEHFSNSNAIINSDTL